MPSALLHLLFHLPVPAPNGDSAEVCVAGAAQLVARETGGQDQVLQAWGGETED